jgi:hypothetical protein
MSRLSFAGSSRLLRQPDENLGVDHLELGTLGIEEPLPGVFRGDDLLWVQLPSRALVRHLEEQQVGQLFGVLDDAHAVVA